MTLRRQLLLIVSLMFLLVFTGNFFISLDNTRQYLIEQLESHAQDAATSLGLSLSPHMAADDLAVMESMVNAIFDRGHYRQIVVETVRGDPLIDRVRPVRVDGVPAWFVERVPLVTPRGRAALMSGWKQGGHVSVQSHPGFAYRELWRDAVEMFWWSLGSFVLAIVLTTTVLRLVLRPLGAVERQALAVAERRFPTLDIRPRTRELRRVVEAMNAMSRKVSQMLNEHSELAEQLRAEAYLDPVTNAGNRRSFDMRLEHLLSAPEERGFGALILVHARGLAEFNREHGFAAGDEFLRGIAALLRNRFDESGELVARIGGAEFGVLLPGVTMEDATDLAGNSVRDMSALRRRNVPGLSVHIGVATWAGTRAAAELMSEADMALRRAQQRGVDGWCAYEADERERLEVHGAGRWREILGRVLEERALELEFQPVKPLALDAVWYHEAFARIRGEAGQLVPAGVFLPMAHRLGLALRFDRLVVESLLERAAGPDARCAVNLSRWAIADEAFRDWLLDALSGHRDAAGALAIEISEHTAQAELEAARALSARLRRLGVHFGLDHVGAGSSAFGYLQGLPLDYIKIDGSYLARIEKDRDSQFFVRTLAEIARGLEVRVIAEYVERDSQLAVLRDLKLDGAQGYLVGRPSPDLPTRIRDRRRPG